MGLSSGCFFNVLARGPIHRVSPRSVWVHARSYFFAILSLPGRVWVYARHAWLLGAVFLDRGGECGGERELRPSRFESQTLVRWPRSSVYLMHRHESGIVRRHCWAFGLRIEFTTAWHERLEIGVASSSCELVGRCRRKYVGHSGVVGSCYEGRQHRYSCACIF